MIAHNEFLYDLRKAFQENGFDIRYVGGCVRDWLHGCPPKDSDLCTDAVPEEQVALYQRGGFRYIETGLQHGTLTVVDTSTNTAYEITSLRRDVETDGRHAKVAFTSDWTADLGRRDLTINAMAMDFDGTLFDPFGGQDDLKKGIVRFVGAAEDRICEDYLRILRYFRFLGRFAKFADDETLDVIAARASGLKQISVERIWSEVSRIIVGPQAEWVVDLMGQTGVSRAIGMWAHNNPLVVSQNPITQLMKLEGGEWDIVSRWKMSTAERRLAIYLTDIESLIPEWDIVGRDIPKEHVVEKLKLFGRFAEARRIAYWEPPAFPISGHDVVNLGFTGKAIGDTLLRMKEDWYREKYVTSREELLARLAVPALR